LKTNDILYKIQKALNLSQEEMLEAYKLADYKMEATHLDSLLKRRQEEGSKLCSYEELGVFLDGLVILKRGTHKQSHPQKTPHSPGTQRSRNRDHL